MIPNEVGDQFACQREVNQTHETAAWHPTVEAAARELDELNEQAEEAAALDRVLPDHLQLRKTRGELMATYFHVDRRAQFFAGQAVELSKLDLSAVPDLSAHCDCLFPEGVSFHGRQYLNLDVKSGNGEGAIELVWEYVRRAYFHDRHSRFTATCAWTELEEAIAWRARTGASNAKVWRLDAAEEFVANMSLLNVSTSTLRASQFAHAYWAGGVGLQLSECLRLVGKCY